MEHFDRALEGLVSHMRQSGIGLDEIVDELKRKVMLQALAESNGNQCRAADKLQIHRNTFARRLESLGIKKGFYVEKKFIGAVATHSESASDAAQHTVYRDLDRAEVGSDQAQRA